ncbi:MAG: hypothetical protein HC905_16900 [Bacteroidales bacterium]|nr:hypothetical protein [Bacteroidales bacterium]
MWLLAITNKNIRLFSSPTIPLCPIKSLKRHIRGFTVSDGGSAKKAFVVACSGKLSGLSLLVSSVVCCS